MWEGSDMIPAQNSESIQRNECLKSGICETLYARETRYSLKSAINLSLVMTSFRNLTIVRAGKRTVLRETNNGDTSSAKSVKISRQSASMATINFVVSHLPARDKRIFMEFSVSDTFGGVATSYYNFHENRTDVGSDRFISRAARPGYKFVLNHAAISIYSVLIHRVRLFDRSVFNRRVFSEIKRLSTWAGANNNNDDMNSI